MMTGCTNAMTYKVQCQYCEYANPRRKIDDKIRCTIFSQWVDPPNSCPAYSDKFLGEITFEDLLGSWEDKENEVRKVRS